MTTNTISIQDLVQREVIYCVSSLVHTLTQENKLDEELAISLWEGPINYDECENIIDDDGSYLDLKDGLWGINDHYEDIPIIPHEYKTRKELIEYYFNDMDGVNIDDGDKWNIENYRQQIFEHWICSEYFIDKLKQHGESVVCDFYGLVVWCRASTGQAIWCDYVVQQIYQELISK